MPDSPPPVMLVIMDGWGVRDAREYNAVAMAETPNFDHLRSEFPYTTLSTSGTDVGLPRGVMGNSEVGHLNIGAGRVVWQDLMRITNSIVDGSFFENPAFLSAIQHVRDHGARLHLFGLVGTALVHSCDEHYLALIRMARQQGLSGSQVVFHVFTDGRDTPPYSSIGPVAELERKLDLYDCGVVGTVIGRYYAMDRDRRWSRIQLAYEAMVNGKADFRAGSALEAVRAAHARVELHESNDYPAETDEFIRPTIIVDEHGLPRGQISEGDALISFNHRADRPREIIRAITEEDFEESTRDDPNPGFARPGRVSVHLVTMTDYRAGFDCPVAFASTVLEGTLAEVVSRAGLAQFHTAETEKYPHVTFFCNGGREQPFTGESRFMANSPQVATYDHQPQMSAAEVTAQALQAIRSGDFSLLILNYANGDMVGHTGVLEAAIRAVETVDDGIGQISQAILQAGGHVLITADHGNCELMWDEQSKGPHTAHTTNPVPCILVSNTHQARKLRSDGRLADLAPTLLELMGLNTSPEMEGTSLLMPTLL